MAGFENILFLDTALGGSVAAIYKAQSRGCTAKTNDAPRGQAETLMPMVMSVMEEAGAEFKDLDAVITTIGPGAFTGLRIGLATAKGLGLALELPVFGITSLQALALSYVEHEAAPAEHFSVVVETRRDDFYVQSFDPAAKPVDEAASLIWEEIAEQGAGILTGDAVERYVGLLQAAGSVCAANVTPLKLVKPDSVCTAFMDVEKQSTMFMKDPDPVYLRAPDVSKPKRKPRRLVDSI
jgi:tRNA threonylcarbamoyladenosine biosynthesis protein TsaB